MHFFLVSSAVIARDGDLDFVRWVKGAVIVSVHQEVLDHGGLFVLGSPESGTRFTGRHLSCSEEHTYVLKSP